MKILNLKKVCLFLTVLFLLSSLFYGCDRQDYPEDQYRVYYEIFVRSFYDSDGDGIGDLNGVTEKLDYLEDLGIDGIWFMPIMPSPTYHKYDVKDYYDIDPQYGTLEDFDELIKAADKKGIKIIIDLVVNHSSNRHPWFESAVDALWKGEDNKYIEYYNFTEENPGDGYNKITDKHYYECRFVSEMPDLNLDNPDVRDEILNIASFWLEKGVGGFRLDAVTYFYTGEKEKNIDFLAWFTEEVKKSYPDAYVISEAWSDGMTIADYYRSNVDSFFNFPYSQATGQLVQNLNNKTANGFMKSIASWNETISSKNPNAIDALFLSNHDQARSAGFLMRDPVRQKMAALLYILAPGNPFIYYGEEIGMTGSGIDENKRLPMLWSVESAEGIPFPPPNANQSVSGIEGVKEQLTSSDSLLMFYKNLLSIRRNHPEIARGKMIWIDSGIKEIGIASFTWQENTKYIIHNLSEFSVDVDLRGKIEGKFAIQDFIPVSAESEKPKISGNEIIVPPMSSIVGLIS
jgi:alpha-amylase